MRQNSELAATYLLTGILLSHTLGYSYTTPFWLPAGFALAAGVRFGYGVLPGAGIGSFLFNISYLGGWELNLDPRVYLTALEIAIGVVAQAAVGVWGVHRLGNPLVSGRKGSIPGFILAIGFGSTLLSATVATAALWQLTPSPVGPHPAHVWLGWWLGDSFGVVVGAPLALAMLSRAPNGISRRSRRRLLVLLGGNLAAILFIHQGQVNQHKRQIEQSFARDVEILQANLNRIYQQNLADLGKLARAFSRDRPPSPQVFHDLSYQIFTDNPSVLAYSWDPVVPVAERKTFERQTRQLLDRDDYLVEGDSLGQDDSMVVVQYVEPLAQNEAALGFNLLSQEDRRQWVYRAFQSGRPTATEVIHLTQAPNEPGYLILQPVYHSQRQPQAVSLDSDQSLAGFVVGVFTVSRMMSAAVNMSELAFMEITLSQAGDRFYYLPLEQPSSHESSHESFYESFYESSLKERFTLDFAEQTWLVTVAAGHGYRFAAPGNTLFEFNLLLTLLGAMGAAVVLGMHTREATLALRVEEKTRDLEYQAHHDTLTGLANRSRLEADLHHRLRQEPVQGFALMLMDLDRFKLVNDSLGHGAGDQLLIELTTRWHGRLGNGATLYRMGGDEFAVIYSTSRNEAEALLEDAKSLGQDWLKTTQQTVSIGQVSFQITASLGVVLCPWDGTNASDAIRNADNALHQAKLLGKNQLQVYQPRHTAVSLESFALEQDLRLAISRHELVLYYQGQYSLELRKLCGFEALLRWPHPDKGMISPAQFIPLAEETQLIVPIGWQVISMACSQLARWQDAGHTIPYVAINISPLQLLQADFVIRLNELVDASGVARHRIELEITETLLLQDPDVALEQLNALHQAGYRLALDDFGTGYSSFNRLKQMPLDRIKIDQCFVKDIGRNSKDEAIILSMIDLSHRLGIEVLAEGVETWEQYHFLLRHGCNDMQGFLLAKPEAKPCLD
ncbi:EAL domain-containing protein [Halomonas sp. Bachu 37]|uniref:bifunctional diguanylate cyclase/phosphodiesterase n=1 Tax=Halomonas kashgarensis TaxID=3084920 RepID=UPI003217EEC2